MAILPGKSRADPRQHELVKHGTIFFPIGCYADNLAEEAVPWHWHEEFEYALDFEKETVFLVENMRVVIQPGDGIFINSGVLHSVERPPRKRKRRPHVRFHSVVFHARLVGGNRDSIFWEKLIKPLLTDSALRYVVLHREIPWQNEALSCFQAVLRAAEKEEIGYENFVRYQLTAALGLLSRNCPVITQSLSEQELVNEERIRIMLDYIHGNFNDELTVEKIAASANISASACLRCFHQLMDTTPIQYVKNLRLEKAAEMLRETSKTAKEAALECGFNDVSYFTKIFREKVGITPKEYQKISRLGDLEEEEEKQEKALPQQP